MTSTTGLLNVAHEIRIDHDNVRDLFERYKQSASQDEKGVIANTLIREMAIHGDAEEISLYNHYAALGLGGTVEHNKEEHAHVKQLILDADKASIKDPHYDEIIANAVQNFIAHAKEEEDDQLVKIDKRLTPEDNDKLAREFLVARTKAPSRPHPMAPQTGGVLQKGAAVQAKVMDKMVEMLGNRKFTDVKYSHSEF